MSGAGGLDQEEDVAQLTFGDFKDAAWIPNSHVALLLQQIADKKYATADRRMPEVFAKSRAYAGRFVGAVELTDVAAIDELFASLRSLEFVRESAEDADGESTRVRLHEYQVRERRLRKAERRGR